MMHQERERIKKDPGLSSVFINPATGDIWDEGTVLVNPDIWDEVTVFGNPFYL